MRPGAVREAPQRSRRREEVGECAQEFPLLVRRQQGGIKRHVTFAPVDTKLGCIAKDGISGRARVLHVVHGVVVAAFDEQPGGRGSAESQRGSE